MNPSSVLALLALTGLYACSPSGNDVEASLVTGSVSYRERMALPPGAVVEVQLQDVSLADAPAKIVSSQRIDRPGQVPIAFALAYDPAGIDPVNRYALQARIEQAGRLLFINDTYTPVLTHGGGRHADMLLVRVDAEPAAPAATSDALSGMFRYLADAAMFMDCRTWLSFPVAMEGGYIELERAYLAAPHEPGEFLQTVLRGRYMARPAMEGDREQVHLVVDRFERLVPGACAPEAHATLANTWWRLTHLDGRHVVLGEEGQEPYMVLGTDGESVRGNGGCNAFFGSYRLEEGRLSFSGLGSTMMFCAEGADSEQAFFAALGKADGFHISGQVLELRAGERTVARFEALYH